jgi:hypothetical protein
MTNSFVAVAEDVLAIFFWIDSPGLIIWNWKTSEMIVVSYFWGEPSSKTLTSLLVRYRLWSAPSRHMGFFFSLQPILHLDKPCWKRLDRNILV